MLLRSLTILAIGVVAFVSGRAEAGPAFTYSASATPNSGSLQSLGFDFKATTSVQVTSLGVYTAIPGSISTGQLIELYDLNTSSIVATAAASTTGIVGAFTYTNLAAPVTLNTNDTYSIFSVFQTSFVGQYGTATPGTFQFASGIVSQPLYDGVSSFVNTGYTVGGSYTPPSTGFANILAVNFQFSPTVVPEPASFGMMGLGLAGLVVLRRKTAKLSA